VKRGHDIARNNVSGRTVRGRQARGFNNTRGESGKKIQGNDTNTNGVQGGLVVTTGRNFRKKGRGNL